MNRLFAKSQSHEAVTSQHLTEELEQKSTNQVFNQIETVLMFFIKA